MKRGINCYDKHKSIAELTSLSLDTATGSSSIRVGSILWCIAASINWHRWAQVQLFSESWKKVVNLCYISNCTAKRRNLNPKLPCKNKINR